MVRYVALVFLVGVIADRHTYGIGVPNNVNDTIPDNGNGTYSGLALLVFDRQVRVCFGDYRGNGDLCKRAFRKNKRIICQCDVHCLLYGDCCVDYLHGLIQNMTMLGMNLTSRLEKENTVVGLSDGSKDIYINDAVFAKHSSCYSFFRSSQPPSFVITSCLNNDTTWNAHCQRPGFSHPVSINVTMDTTIVFKNKYCAFCHGLERKDFVPWSVRAKCPQNITDSNQSDYLQENVLKMCILSYSPPNNVGYPRPCYMESSNCSLSSRPDDILACSLYISPVKVNDTMYKNEHCARCLMTNDSWYPSCIHYEGVELSYSKINSLDILFDFHFDDNEWAKYENKPTCKENEVYRYSTKSCEILDCPLGSRFRFGKCEYDDGATLPIEFERTEYNITAVIRLNRSCNITYTTEDDDAFTIKSMFGNPMSDLETSCSNDTHNCFNECNASLTLDHHFDLSAFLNSLQKRLQKRYLHRRVLNVLIKNFNDLSGVGCSYSSSLTTANNVTISYLNTSWYGNDSDRNITINLSKSRFVLVMTNNPNNTKIEQMHYCLPVPVNLSCSFVSYREGEFRTTENGVVITSNSREISPGSFIVIDGILYACQYVDGDMGLLIPMSLIASVLGLSDVSLIIVLAFHVLFPKLRNLHGKILVNFCLCLLFGQSLYLVFHVTYVYRVLCVIIAMTLHFLWLSIFLWMSVMAFDIARNFSARSMMSANNINHVVRFRRYCFVAYGVPTGIVTVFGILDFWSPVDIRYGDNTIGLCWISNTYANLVAYAMPLIGSIIFNIICFFLALHGIETTSRKTKNVVKSRANRSRCIVYSKLFILLGITWIFGFISTSANLLFFRYFNTILNGLQGFFIFVAFITNSRVKREISRRRSTSYENTADNMDAVSNDTNLQLSEVQTESTATCSTHM